MIIVYHDPDKLSRISDQKNFLFFFKKVLTFSYRYDRITVSGGDADPNPSEGRPWEPSKGTPEWMCAVLPMGENTRLQLSLLNTGQNAVGAILSVSLTDFREISQKPLTSRSRSAIIRAQVEARQSPQRARPARVRKTEPMKPPRAEVLLRGI